MSIMKKILCFILLVAMLLSAAVGCGTDDVTTETPSVTTGGNDYSFDLPEGEQIVKHSYTAVLNDEMWSGVDIDTSIYEMLGTGAEIYSKAKTEYKSYQLTFVILENGVETSYTGTSVFNAMRSIASCGATVTKNEAAKTATVKVTPIETKVLPSWKAVTAKADSYIKFEFTASKDMEYAVSVTPEKGGSKSTSAYNDESVTVSGTDGKYVGTAQCTVPYDAGKTYYVNICVAGSFLPLASIPLNITNADYNDGFHLRFAGDWDLVEDESYTDKFTKIFHNFYPQVYTRWAVRGDEAKTFDIRIDKTYDGVANATGSRILIGLNYINGGPDKLTIMGHEGTHVMQSYGGKLSYGGESTYTDPVSGKKYTANNWWTENMANYGALRYCHYSYTMKTVHGQVFDVNTNAKLWDWGYGGYSDGGKMFIAWLDWNYPSIDKNGDGKVQRDEMGVVDLVNYTIKTHGEWFYDNPYDPTSPFNKAFAEASGGAFKTAEEARLIYAEECRTGKYTFKGFRDYRDNWITENIPNVSTNNLLMMEPATPTGKTNPILAAAITTGNNLCAKGAEIESVGSYGMNGRVEGNLIDGDLTTLYQASRFSDLHKFNGISNDIIIDLGKTMTFDTYTLVTYSASVAYVAKTWEILVSDNGVNFTPIDCQKNNTEGTVSVTFEEVSARYVEIRLFEPDQNGVGITRLCEFMLFDLNK